MTPLEDLMDLVSGQEFTRVLLESVPGGVVVVGLAGEVLRANPEAVRLLGYTFDELQQRYVSDWQPETLREDGSPYPVADYPVSRCLQTGERQGPDTVGIRLPGGETTWAVFNAAPLRRTADGPLLGTIVTFLDVSARIASERQLRASEERFRLLVEVGSDTVLVANRERKIVYINRVAVGFSMESVLGTHLSSHVPEAFRAENERAADAAFAGESVTFEVPANNERWYASHAAPLERSSNGEVETILIVTRDVTEERRTKAERRKLDAALTARVEDMAMLAGGIAHDFNNLLVGIVGNLELALRSLPRGSPAGPRLTDARSSAMHAGELTRQLLAYSGRGRILVTNVDLNELLESMQGLMRAELSRRSPLELQLCNGLPPLAIDATQLRQVIMNLIGNAADALSSRQGRVFVRTGRAGREQARAQASHPVEGELPPELLFVEVEDEGCGMDRSTVSRMFDPFFSTKVRGRGLGMASVLGIVRSCGGLISVDSDPGRGTRVRVLFPPSDSPAEGSTPMPQDSARLDLKSSLNGRRVLVIDDEPPVRRVVELALQDADAAVLCVETAGEALALVRAEPRRFELLISDLRLPDRDGSELLTELRTICDAPQIVMTGFAEHPGLENLDLVGVLHKPFGIADLLELCERALKPEPDTTDLDEETS